jgi:DNA polymerase III subunit alpha
MFLIFDTETTGLPLNYNAPIEDLNNWPRVVQISWQLHELNGQLVEHKNFIIKSEGY